MRPIFNVIFLALLFCITAIQASPEDSLKNVLANSDGIEKLETLKSLLLMKLGEADAIDYTIMLEEEARKQNNEDFTGYALMFKSVIYGNDINKEKFFSAVEEAMVYTLQEKQIDRYFILFNTKIKAHLDDGYYETAFLKISAMLEEAKKFNSLWGELFAYENMGYAYFLEKHYQKALEEYQKVFLLLSTHFPEPLANRVESGYKIINVAYIIGDIPLTLLFCDSVMYIVEEVERTRSKVMENYSTSYIKNWIYTYYALAYISTGREKEATDAINMALKYAEDNMMDTERRVFYSLCAEYYYKKGEYKTALEYIEKYEEQHTYSFPEDVMLTKSKTQAVTGNFEGAYKTEQEYRELADSLNRQKLSQRISELHTIHQVEKIELQAEQERLETANIWLLVWGLTIIVLLLVCFISIIIYNFNKTKQKNRVLYQRIQSQEALEVELNKKEEALHANLLSDDEAPDDEVSDDEVNSLYFRLKDLMKNEKSYTDPNLTRKALASKLGTNEKYLHKTIKKHLDLSFSEYINLLRLDYARKMISRHFHETTIEDVAIKSGFGTRQTFHRLFRDRYGLSPSEFSKLLKKS